MSCAFWVRIPVELIDRVELITFVSCQGHEYPYVRICLKEVANNPAAAVLSDRSGRANSIPSHCPPGGKMNSTLSRCRLGGKMI
jgi:hypothetical protein